MGRVAAMAMGALALTGCAATEAPPEVGDAPGFVAVEAAAIARSCLTSGFSPEVTAMVAQARGYRRSTPISPMLSLSDPAGGALTARRISVPARGPCEIVLDSELVNEARTAMRRALRDQAFTRDRAQPVETWVRARQRIELVRVSQRVPRDLPKQAALRLVPLD